MQKYKTIFRIAADIIMVILLAWFPLWSIIVFSIAFAWIFAPYYEIIAWGLAMDSLYGMHSLYGVSAAFVIFVIIEVFKRRTRI